MTNLDEYIRAFDVDPRNAREVARLARQLHRVSRRRRASLTPYWQQLGQANRNMAFDLITFAQEVRKQARVS
jgi:hypothetical protein